LGARAGTPVRRAAKLKTLFIRSIKAIDLELSDTTVLIGPNNAGKTAILDALRIVLTRRWGQHGTGFTEYDVHLADEHSDPKAPPGVSIEIRVEEQQAGEWPEALQQDLDEIVQTDPVTGKTFIILRASCAWNEVAGSFEPSWVFLNAGRAPLIGGSARRMNLERFWQYLPVFYLGALRDVDDEFSPPFTILGSVAQSPGRSARTGNQGPAGPRSPEQEVAASRPPSRPDRRYALRCHARLSAGSRRQG